MKSTQGQLQQTIKHLYGDLLDFPIFSQEMAAPELVNEISISQAPAIKETLHSFSQSISHCQQCSFYLGRKNLVFGKGDVGARVAFVGDLPTLEEDQAGLPFTGETGELLHKMVLAMQLKPSEVYFTTLFKCRPPANKTPGREEFLACEKHLQKQMALVQPEMIVAFGEMASKALAHSEAPLSVLRKQEFSWNDSRVICTYHPRDLLKNPSRKKEAWDDLKLVMKKLGLS